MGSMEGAACWAFDFDGTVSYLVAARGSARLHPLCARLIRDLVRRGRRVAILSSRRLADIERAVEVPGVYLAGGSGLEWRLPRGGRVRPGAGDMERLRKARQAWIPRIREISEYPGVELEDKRWSLAIHLRHASGEDAAKVERAMATMRDSDGIRYYHGPKALEVQFLPEVNKAFGVRAFTRIARGGEEGRGTVYSGDDENDATAMRWVLSHGGSACVVGNRIRVPGAVHVPDPAGLARMLRRRAFGNGR